jgi:hypothetical protein
LKTYPVPIIYNNFLKKNMSLLVSKYP